MNYEGKIFRPKSVSDNGEVSPKVVFHYHQEGSVLTCTYTGGNILKGHLIGIVSANGYIDMSYHQVLNDHSIQTGVCQSKPEILANGKLRLHESWQWTSGDKSKGISILEEV